MYAIDAFSGFLASIQKRSIPSQVWRCPAHARVDSDRCPLRQRRDRVQPEGHDRRVQHLGHERSSQTLGQTSCEDPHPHRLRQGQLRIRHCFAQSRRTGPLPGTKLEDIMPSLAPRYIEMQRCATSLGHSPNKKIIYS